ncbi:hypothetical protein K458DRAFT_384027 [Lentithecium fluviatile CBS 122367]|uniref:Uncharacterized protein n=1 Tax=Lentithecium fluviatile CBS 122367 TaxID=1168545 RepID=A0A6G1JGS5_9PLEO|nr:hypothetical protein K458DRAFT_384027 [Lentithecium fluviatile CBS 122367]
MSYPTNSNIKYDRILTWLDDLHSPAHTKPALILPPPPAPKKAKKKAPPMLDLNKIKYTDLNKKKKKKKIDFTKIDLKSPHAIRDLFGPRPAQKIIPEGRRVDDGRMNFVQREMREEMCRRRKTEAQVDAGWAAEVREREAYFEKEWAALQKLLVPACCQCFAPVVVGEWVAPVCLECYHSICEEGCMVLF